MASMVEENMLDWDDVSHCNYKLNEQDEVILDIAGGGSHAWSYILKWNEDDEEDEPTVYQWSYPFKEENKILQRGKTLMLRGENDSQCQSVALIDKQYNRIEDNIEHYYCGLYKPELPIN